MEQKSGESDELSFDHILKKLDQNDAIKMNKTESYKYDLPLRSGQKPKHNCRSVK